MFPLQKAEHHTYMIRIHFYCFYSILCTHFGITFFLHLFYAISMNLLFVGDGGDVAAVDLAVC